MIPEYEKVLSFLNSDELQIRVDFITERMLVTEKTKSVIMSNKGAANDFIKKVLSKIGEWRTVPLAQYGTAHVIKEGLSGKYLSATGAELLFDTYQAADPKSFGQPATGDILLRKNAEGNLYVQKYTSALKGRHKTIGTLLGSISKQKADVYQLSIGEEKLLSKFSPESILTGELWTFMKEYFPQYLNRKLWVVAPGVPIQVVPNSTTDFRTMIPQKNVKLTEKQSHALVTLAKYTQKKLQQLAEKAVECDINHDYVGRDTALNSFDHTLIAPLSHVIEFAFKRVRQTAPTKTTLTALQKKGLLTFTSFGKVFSVLVTPFGFSVAGVAVPERPEPMPDVMRTPLHDTFRKKTVETLARKLELDRQYNSMNIVSMSNVQDVTLTNTWGQYSVTIRYPTSLVGAVHTTVKDPLESAKMFVDVDVTLKRQYYAWLDTFRSDPQALADLYTDILREALSPYMQPGPGGRVMPYGEYRIGALYSELREDHVTILAANNTLGVDEVEALELLRRCSTLAGEMKDSDIPPATLKLLRQEGMIEPYGSFLRATNMGGKVAAQASSLFRYDVSKMMVMPSKKVEIGIVPFTDVAGKNVDFVHTVTVSGITFDTPTRMLGSGV